jgi:hypothetical protein
MQISQPPIQYIDTRSADSTEHVSLDLTRHLPQRSSVGTVIVVADDPSRLLPVVRKRWMRIIREVERQRSSTLDRSKRLGLQYEVDRMKSLHFTSKINHPNVDVLFITPAQTVCELPAHHTLYVVSQLTSDQFLAATESAEHGAVVVAYGDWEPYKHALRAVVPGANFG